MIEQFVKKAIYKEEEKGIEEILSELKSYMRHVKQEFSIIVFVNFFVIICTPLLFESENIVKIIIAIVLWGTIFFTVITAPWELILKGIFTDKLNLKRTVYQEIYKEVNNRATTEYDGINFVSKYVNDWKGKDIRHIAYSISEKAIPIVMKTVWYFIVVCLIIYILYILVRNLLIDKMINVSIIDILWYPFDLLF